MPRGPLSLGRYRAESDSWSRSTEASHGGHICTQQGLIIHLQFRLPQVSCALPDSPLWRAVVTAFMKWGTPELGVLGVRRYPMRGPDVWGPAAQCCHRLTILSKIVLRPVHWGHTGPFLLPLPLSCPPGWDLMMVLVEPVRPRDWRGSLQTPASFVKMHPAAQNRKLPLCHLEQQSKHVITPS